ncbi:MAG: DUF2071 domain-containing protein [Verrucomicrobia bacterium]|nr:DUF2071 domain-containing protein [Verrucomicrobiota bacterium]
MHEPSGVFEAGGAERRTPVRREPNGGAVVDPKCQRADLEFGAPSAAAIERMRSRRGEPLFVADWERALMLHLEVDADELQRAVPFPLDLRDGRAFVSLVAFTLRGMRPAFGGRLGAWLMKPIATHHFLNVRAYVRHRGEPGIFFLAEWLSNRLAVCSRKVKSTSATRPAKPMRSFSRQRPRTSPSITGGCVNVK